MPSVLSRTTPCRHAVGHPPNNTACLQHLSCSSCSDCNSSAAHAMQVLAPHVYNAASILHTYIAQAHQGCSMTGYHQSTPTNKPCILLRCTYSCTLGRPSHHLRQRPNVHHMALNAALHPGLAESEQGLHATGFIFIVHPYANRFTDHPLPTLAPTNPSPIRPHQACVSISDTTHTRWTRL